MANATVLNSLLQFALDKNTNKFGYDEFYSFLRQNGQQASSYDRILTQLKCLDPDFVRLINIFGGNNFELEFEVSSRIKIEITKKQFYCYNYDSKSNVCRNENCKYLHVCSKIFTRAHCSCKLNHSLNTEHNLKQFESRSMTGIDFKLLKSYFKRFVSDDDLVSCQSGTLSSRSIKRTKTSKRPRSRSRNRLLRNSNLSTYNLPSLFFEPKEMNQNQSTNFHDSYSRKIEIQLTESVVKLYDDHLLFLFLNKKNETTDEDIEKKEYLPDQLKAFITYKEKSVAERIAEKKEINFIGNVLKIVKSMEPHVQKTPETASGAADFASPNIPRLIKPLKNNVFLSLILKHEKLRRELIESVSPANITVTAKQMLVTANSCNEPEAWLRKSDTKITNFFNKFHRETIELNEHNEYEVKELKKIIDETRSIYSLFYDEKDNKLYIIGKIDYMKSFFSRFNMFESLREPNENNKNQLITKSISLPKNQIYGFNGLVNLAMSKLATKLNLIDFNLRNSQLILTGTKTSIDSSEKSLRKLFDSIKHQRIEEIKNCATMIQQSKNFGQIIRECLKTEFETKYVYQISIQASVVGMNETSEENGGGGVFITYFYDCPEIDSIRDTVYAQISKYLAYNLDIIELNVSKYAMLLNTTNWKSFEQENFSKAKLSNNMSFSLARNHTEQIQIYLVGRKDDCLTAKIRIQKFFSNNESKTSSIDLSEEDFLYLKHVAYDERKCLEALYSIKIEHKPSNRLIINDCPNNKSDEIKQKILEICSRKKIKTFGTESLPGFAEAYKINRFKQELEAIQKETCTFIQDELVSTKTDHLNKTTPKEATNQSINNSLNKISNSVQIGQSKLCLEIGCITATNADVIVNSTSRNLQLNCGSLSKVILDAAGNTIQQEAHLMYPNGIKADQVALTQAGLLKLVKFIFHTTSPHFIDTDTCSQTLKTLVNNCLKKMAENNLKSISFPSIGSGGLNYPPELVAQVMIETCKIFLIRSNPKSSYHINFVISEQFSDILKWFQLEFSKLSIESNSNETENVLSIFKPSIEKSALKLKVLYKHEIVFSIVKTKINELCNKSIVKDKMTFECQELSENELNDFLKDFPNSEINIKRNTIELHGLEEEIMKVKLEITNLITEKNQKWLKSRAQELHISKSVQWQYEISPGKWVDFPVELNGQIESAHSKNDSKFTFKKNGIVQSVCFEQSQYPMKILDETNCILSSNVQRLDLQKIQRNGIVSYPDNWSKMQDKEDFCLFDVDATSAEFLKVSRDFTSKLGRSSLKYLKIQRVQNKPLFQAYMIFKNKLKNKLANENELVLWHGTKSNIVQSISCHGFNRSFAGINGVAYGHGVYFAVNSSYSHNYTDVHSGSVLNMFRVKVLVGESTVGNSSMKVPPKKVNGELFDSTCDTNKSIFVAYHDNQCYPEYLIHYII